MQETTKKAVYLYEKAKLDKLGISILAYDFERPWGGFFVIDESSTQNFITAFYPELAEKLIGSFAMISPKILCVAPNQRLSWQYHHRRAELWKLIDGKAGYIKSKTDEQGKLQNLKLLKTLTLQQGERHRLVGLSEWGIIAEIWQHTDTSNLSNEDDIIRLQDDYSRD